MSELESNSVHLSCAHGTKKKKEREKNHYFKTNSFFTRLEFITRIIKFTVETFSNLLSVKN